MGIFDQFQSREDLLKAVESAIQTKTVKPEGDGGGAERDVFFIADESQSALAELKAKFETAVKDNQNYRKRAQTAESSLAELKQENARLAATLEEHSKFDPEKQRDKINSLLDEIGKLKADNKALSDQVDPLNRVIADYKAKENERIIDKALIDEAAKLGVRPEAMRDVMFRRSLLEVSDIGTVQTKEGGVPVSDFMKTEFEASPLWHPQSQGGGSNPGTSGGSPSPEALYQQAKEKRDIGGMFTNAPEFKGVTFGSREG